MILLIRSLARHGLKAGFFARVSDDQLGDFVTHFFEKEGIDTSRIRRCEHGEKIGLTFTEILSRDESSILMYRNCIADLQLCPADIDEEYIKNTKAILFKTYHSATLNTANEKFIDFCKKAKEMNVPMFVSGPESDTNYESTKIYNDLNINILPYGTFISTYMKLWADLSKL